MRPFEFAPLVSDQTGAIAAPSDTVRIVELTQTNFARWDEFVTGCSEATFFHRAGWKTVIERAFGHNTYFLYAETNGQIDGVLPLAEVNSFLFGHSLRWDRGAQ
jgi:hypothetical protein